MAIPSIQYQIAIFDPVSRNSTFHMYFWLISVLLVDLLAKCVVKSSERNRYIFRMKFSGDLGKHCRDHVKRDVALIIRQSRKKSIRANCRKNYPWRFFGYCRLDDLRFDCVE